MAKVESMGFVPEEPTAVSEWQWPEPIGRRGRKKPDSTSLGHPDTGTQDGAPKRISYWGIEHFGEQLNGSKFGDRMTREMYAYPNRSQHQRPKRERVGERFWEATAWAYRDEEHAQHSDAYLLVQRDAALVNFDLSMRYFQSLDGDEFEAALEHVLAKGRTFKPVESLKDWDGVTGAYVMVFDEYKQFYVGKADDIRKRVKQHWSSRKSFDRLIFGTKYDSIFPVDELRALDTTRIYAARSANPYAVEQRAENAADHRFCLNRMAGGSVAPLTLMLTAANPRSRTNGVAVVSLSLEGRKLAREEVAMVIARARSTDGSGLVAGLAGLDMTIYSVENEDGSSFMWSRRDAIAGAAARGELSVEEFAAFLEAMGETVIWPES